MDKRSIPAVLRGALLIAGTTIGAGMLGIPLVTSNGGFWPGVGVTFLVWLFMWATGLALLEVSLWMPRNAHFLSIAKKILGDRGKWLTGMLFIFLYYCLLVAYFAAGAPLLAAFIENQFGIAIEGGASYFLFALLFGTIVGLGPRSIDRVNMILIVAMVCAYVGLIGAGSVDVEKELLMRKEPLLIFGAVPVLFSGFGYHNLVPSLATYFKRDKKVLQRSLFWGTLIPLIVYLIWQWLTLGSVPNDVMQEVRMSGGTAATALELVTGSKSVALFARFFAFFAVVTSLLGVSFSMVDFLADAWKISPIGGKRVFLTFVTFFPPMMFALYDPNVFTKALSTAGGFGESTLNGLIPIALLWVGRYKMGYKERAFSGGKALLFILACFGAVVFLFELNAFFSQR